MKKIEYKAPEMEIIALKNTIAILAGSGETVDNPPSETPEPGDY